MKSSSRSVSAVDSETSKHSKHPVALRLFYSVIVAVVAAALLPVIPAAAVAPRVSSAAASAYIPVTPVRILDTRITGGPLAANTTRDLVVTGASPLAPAGATAVMLNVTVTNTTLASFLTVYGTSSSRPLASNLNWKPGQTIPNLVETPVGANGSVTFYNAAGSTDVVADLEGYYFAPNGSAGGEVALTPARITDTRAGSGQANAGSTLAAGASLAIQATGAGGVPSAGVSGVILNVTVTNTTAASFLTVWPTGAPQNVVSNLNWVAGQTIPNRVFVPVGTGGKVSVFNAAGSTDVVVDVSGYFTTASATGQLFTPQIPLRIEDTRSDGKTLAANTSFSIQIGGLAGVPVGAKAVILNVTATDTTASSFLTVYPSTATRPLASDLNWNAGVTIPNLTVATLGTTGMVSFYNAAGSADVVVDLFGFFGAGGGVTVTATPSSLPANGTSTSKINTTVLDNNGNPIALDPVSYTLTPSVTGSCGSLVPSSGTTNGAGVVPTSTYTATAVVGTCTITATEALGAKTGSVTITQTAPPNAISFGGINGTDSNCNGCSIPVDANGGTVTLTTTTTNTGTGLPVSGDTLTFTTGGGAACGTIGSILPAGGLTAANGQVSFVYTSSNVVGFCTITATESLTGATKSVVVTQNTPTKAGFNAVAVTVPVNCSGFNDLCVPANGTATSPVKVNVQDFFGIPANNDGILATSYIASTPGSCGTLSPSSGSTNAAGDFTTTYTASTTAGSCTITFTESDSATTGQLFITQRVVPNKVVVSANPASIVANGASTSALTVTVTNGVSGAAVSADAVSFSTSGTCGAVTGSTTPTNAAGQVTATYTSSGVSGFCTITAQEASTGGRGTVLIDQTQPGTSGLTTAVTASTPVQADGTTGITVMATVTASGAPISGDPVRFTFSGSPAGVCNFAPIIASTNGSGVAQISYTASTTVGTCAITGTEAFSGSSGSATVTQTAVTNQITLTVVSPQTIGGAQTSVTAVVTHLGVAVNSDTVTFALSANPTGSCGILSATSGNTGTGNTGTVTVQYAPSAVIGFCTITATESANGQSASKTITQTANPAAANSVTVTDNKGSTLVANGSSTATITAMVGGTGNHLNDTVMFTLSANNTGACGTITPTSGNTGTGATVTATYTASTIVGICTITATEANGGTSGTDPINQTPRPNNITLSPTSGTTSTSGGGTLTLTVTVTNGNTGTGINADAITFTLTPSGAAGTCGTLAGGSTNTSGVFTSTYTTGAIVGSCTITAHEAATSQTSSTTTIVQTA